MEFRVNWKGLWKSLTKYMTIAIVASITLIMVVRFFSNGFTYESVFKHLSPIEYIYMFFVIWGFCGVFSLLIALWVRAAKVTIKDENLHGRNYWGFKKIIPLNGIKSLEPFSDNGINAVIADAGKHGKIFIYIQTERLDELIEIIESKMQTSINA